jgi:hypothetical protein
MVFLFQIGYEVFCVEFSRGGGSLRVFDPARTFGVWTYAAS